MLMKTVAGDHFFFLLVRMYVSDDTSSYNRTFRPRLFFVIFEPCRTLAFAKAAKGDVRAALERIGRCVEVCERYPGLCRSVMG